MLASSAIIEDIDAMRKAGLASLAFFYCDFISKEGPTSSFLVQLRHQSDSYSDIISKFYSDHAKGSRHPSDGALAGCLKDLLKLPGLAPVYLIVDALDECPNTSAVQPPRAKVLSFVKELIESQLVMHMRRFGICDSNLLICVTSRLWRDTKHILDPLIFHFVSLHGERGQKRDIEEYIKSVIYTNPETSGTRKTCKGVIDVLAEKSDGT